MFGGPKTRFVQVHEEKLGSGDFTQYITVIVDTTTGVQYLVHQWAPSGTGLTVLVDAAGKPILDPKYAK